jgi:hypothetical protein
MSTARAANLETFMMSPDKVAEPAPDTSAPELDDDAAIDAQAVLDGAAALDPQAVLQEPTVAGAAEAAPEPKIGTASQEARTAHRVDGAAWLARASAELLDQPEEDPTIERIVEKAAQVIPGCDFCGCSIRRGKHAETPASTDPIADKVDQLQYDLGEGPCLDAIWVDDVYVIDDVREDGRWPRWARATEDLGVRSILSVRLATSADTLGSLNLYARNPHAFGPDTVDLAQAYGALAASALGAARKVTQLQRALETRHRIGLAQGILMVQYRMTENGAFELLRRYSQEHNVKLRDVASEVVASLGRRAEGSASSPPTD